MPKRFNRSIYFDKRSLASAIEKSKKEKKDTISSVFIGLKFCFSLLAVISLIRVGYTSKLRLSRLKEINNSFLYEKARNKVLSARYDDLISFEGEQRFMKDQDQMISRDVIRVIWR